MQRRCCPTRGVQGLASLCGREQSLEPFKLQEPQTEGPSTGQIKSPAEVLSPSTSVRTDSSAERLEDAVTTIPGLRGRGKFAGVSGDLKKRGIRK